jgi:hypothetical protein
MTQSDDEGPIMYGPVMGVFLNRWFTTYEAARAAREADGGYLLPFKHESFVADRAAIVELGLDPDWARIGGEWVRPLDSAAWTRLKEEREVAE